MQGVHRPEGSVNWHYQKKLPKDLQGQPEAPRNGWGHRGTLGTSDLREANCRAAQLLAELEERWALMRQALTIMPPQAAPLEQVVHLGVQSPYRNLTRPNGGTTCSSPAPPPRTSCGALPATWNRAPHG